MRNNQITNYMERIQELTEKIRLEGVEKGKAEAEEIIAKARAEAAQIVSTAKEQADAIMQQAKKANSELETNTKSELKLYLAQAINALKSEVTNVVTDRIVGSAVADMAADKDFLGQFAVALAKQWTKDEDIVISTPEAETLKAYFAKQAKDLLDKGVTIEKINGQQVMFSVSPADGSYRVDFGKEEFERFFKSFLRPQLIDMLF
jgi:V/A-type H+-transporting ATPase subunit E